MKERNEGKRLRSAVGRHLAVLGVAAGLLGVVAPGARGAGDPRDAMVKVFATERVPDYDEPWSTGYSLPSSGSGSLIEGGRILTNAHVVMNAAYVEVRRNGSAKRFEARVEFVSHAADLALLRVDDERFARGVAPLALGELPRAGEEITAYGFPTGGDSLSVTRGVVSRVEHQSYVHSGRFLLAVQVDAAVNPGNSGGPALIDGRLAGVAMQGMTHADNISYLIPVTRVAHFLDDVADGRLDGIPELGVETQQATHRDLRRRYGLGEGRGGVRVTGVFPGSSADGVLVPGDVILGIDGHEVASDGTTTFRPHERTGFEHFLQLEQVGTEVALEVMRDRGVQHLRATLRAGASTGRLVPEREFTTAPRYFIYAGLVFQPLTLNYLFTWGGDWMGDAPLAMTRRVGRASDRPGREVVILQTILDGPLNRGYQQYGDLVVTSVDGKAPLDFAEFVALVEADGRGFAVIEYEGGVEMALDRARVAVEAGELMETYGVESDRSEDLAAALPHATSSAD